MDWSTVIVGTLSLVGTLAGSYSGMKLMSYRIEQLEKRVNEHNNVIRRTFVLEEQMKVANHRIDDLERHEEEREHG
jgi:sensor histidine kinase YesM